MTDGKSSTQVNWSPEKRTVRLRRENLGLDLIPSVSRFSLFVRVFEGRVKTSVTSRREALVETPFSRLTVSPTGQTEGSFGYP